MAQSTYNTKLFIKNSLGSFVELIPIKDFPDLGGDPELLSTTTLSDRKETYIQGIQSMEALKFVANYSIIDFARVASYDDNKTHDFEIRLGNDGNGEDGIFFWKGTLSVWKTAGAVNGVLEMQISIAPSTEISLKQAVAVGVSLSKNLLNVEATIQYFNSTTSQSPQVTYAWESGNTVDALSTVAGTSSTIVGATSKYYRVTANVSDVTGSLIGGTFISEPFQFTE